MALDTLARIALSPLLVAQALQVRRNALVLPEPPGPRSGRLGDGPQLRLLILGDSSAAGVGASHQDTALSGQLTRCLAHRFALDWRLQARTGATTAATIKSLENIEDIGQFDIAVIALGVNDVTRLVPGRRWTIRQRALHRLLSDRFGVRRIIASGVPPMGQFPLLPQPLRWVLGQHAARLDTALSGLAGGTPGLSHLRFDMPLDPGDMATDGFHPGPSAYAVWARHIAALIPDGPV
jgi:lysophospholipase L1-like esterase